MICAVKYKAKQLLGATQHTDWKLFSMRRWNRLFFVSTMNKPSPLFCLYSLTSAWWTTLADRKSWMPVDSSWQLLKQGLCMKTILMVKPTLEARYIRWNLSPNVLAINLFASSCMCLRPNMMERFHETLPEVRWAAGHFLLCNAFMAQHWAPFFWAIAMLLAGHFPPNGPVSSSGTTKRKNTGVSSSWALMSCWTPRWSPTWLRQAAGRSWVSLQLSRAAEFEVNHLPSFTCDSPLDEDIKQSLGDFTEDEWSW